MREVYMYAKLTHGNRLISKPASIKLTRATYNAFCLHPALNPDVLGKHRG